MGRVVLRIAAVLAVWASVLVAVPPVVAAQGAPAGVPTPSTYVSAVMADQPLGYWRMDEGSVVASDASGNGRDGSPTDAISAVVGGPFGSQHRAYRFDGGCGIDVSAYAEAFQVQELSVEAWVKPETLGYVFRSRNYGFGLVAGEGAGAFEGWESAARSGGAVGGLPEGEWSHIVGVHDARGWRYFLNGMLLASSAGSGVLFYEGSELKIGADGNACSRYAFVGLLSNVAIYGTALSAERVRAHYDAAPNRPPAGSSFGSSAPANAGMGDPVDTATGSFYQGFTDLEPTAGLPGLPVSRSYNSLDLQVGVMGRGWTAPFSARVVETELFADVTLPDGRVVRVLRDPSGSAFVRPDGLTGGLSRDPDGSLRLVLNGGEVWEFDTAGRLERSTDPSGVSASVVRDAAGLVTEVQSSAGPRLTFSSSGGLLTGVVSSDGRSVAYGYDDGGRLTSSTDAAGATTTYGYDDAGLLATVTDPTGLVLVRTVYDVGGRAVAQWTPAGGDEAFAYDDAARTTVHTVVATGEQITYVHDANGRLVRVVDPAGNGSDRRVGSFGYWDRATDRAGVTSSSTRDARGNVVSVTDPASGTTTMTYDALDRPLTVTSPATGRTTFSYAGSGTSPVASSVTDALGGVTTRTIVDGLVVSETDPDGVVASFTYTPNRQVASVTVAGATTSFDYFPAGWLRSARSPEGRVTAFTYDGVGRVLSRTAPDGGVTRWAYDAAGRLLTETDPTGAVRSFGYDTAGRLVSVAEPGKPATTYSYNAVGELTRATDPSGVVTETGYGALGRVEWTTDGAGRRTAYTYRTDGLLETVTAPDGGVTMYRYDAAGRLSAVVDPKGRTTTTGYDTAGRVVSVTAPDGGVTRTAYDTVGRVVRVTDPTGRSTVTAYTPAGRVRSVTDPARVRTTSTYDTSGRLWKVADPLRNTTVYTYTADGLTASETSPSGLVTRMTYTQGGHPATVTDPAGVRVTRTWSTRGELLTEQTSGRGAMRFTYNPDGTMATATDAAGAVTSYAYDAAGRMVSARTPAGTEQWGYTNGELTSRTAPAVGTTPGVTTYARDAAGRISVVTDPTGRSTTDVYDTAGDLVNRTHQGGGAATIQYGYGYDAAGRVTTVSAPEGTYATAYDVAGRVTAELQPDGRFVRYEYDAGGRRSRMQSSDGTELAYVYDAAGRVRTVAPTATMADFFTAPNGTAPDPLRWSTSAAGGGGAVIDGNRLRLSTTATTGSSVQVRSGAAQRADVSVVASFQAASATAANRSRVVLAARTNSTGSQGYRLEVSTDSASARVVRRSGGVDTVLGSLSTPPAGTEMRAELEVVGSSVRARVWSASAAPPATWGLSVTDTAVSAAGAVLVRSERVAGSNSVRVDGFVQRNDPGVAVAPAVTVSYDADGRVTREQFGSGARVFSYASGRVVRVVQSVPGAARSTDVAYDAAGSVASTSVGGVVTGYRYDGAGRLVSVSSAGVVTAFAYDGAGRRTSMRVGSATTRYAYDARSRLTRVTPPSGSATTFAYDAAGRRVRETTGTTSVSLGWDAAGRLVSVSGSSRSTQSWSQQRSLAPDGLVRSVSAAVGSSVSVSRVDWDRAGVGVAQPVVVADGAVSQLLVRGPEGWAATVSGAGVVPVASDVFGSTIVSSGQRLASASGWDVWGNPVPVVGVASVGSVRLGFRGEVTVGGGTFLRAREYQAATGVFLSVDPLEDVAGSPVMGNRYHYAGNDPVNRVDPTGMRPGDATVDPNPCAPYVGLAGAGQAVFFRAGSRDCWVGPADLDVNDPCLDTGVGQRVANGAGGVLSGMTFGIYRSSRVCAATPEAILGNVVGDVVVTPLLAGLVFKAGSLFNRARVATEAVDIAGANFAQTTASRTFSSGGTFAGQSIDDVAGALRSGAMSAKDVPVQVIVRDGNTLILNTRSALALEQAGVPRSAWNVVNVTGDPAAQARLAGQLARNGLDSTGTSSVRITGAG